MVMSDGNFESGVDLLWTALSDAADDHELLVQILLLLLSAGLFFKAVGYDFFTAINYLYNASPAKYPLSAPPYSLMICS